MCWVICIFWWWVLINTQLWPLVELYRTIYSSSLSLFILHTVTGRLRHACMMCVKTLLHDTSLSATTDLSQAVALQAKWYNNGVKKKKNNNWHTLWRWNSNNLSLGSQAFRVSAPKVWNTLPLHIRQPQSLSTFRCHLKSHYFQLAYPAT